MLNRLILCSSIAALWIPVAGARAETQNIPAQPIDTSAAVGNEQANFFLSRDHSANQKMTFSTNLKTLTNKKGTFDTRALFVQRIEGFDRTDNLITYVAVDKTAPLKKLTTYVIPAGGVLDDFLFNSNSTSDGGNQGLPEAFFHVPTHGLYFATGGGAPALVKAITGDFSGYALRQPGFIAADPDHNEAFRVVLEATDVKHGAEPYISQGPASTTALLEDEVIGTTGSDPRSFTTFQDPNEQEALHTVYFLTTATNGTVTVNRVFEDNSNPKKVKYGVTQVVSGLTDDPLQIIGGSDTLYLRDATNLYAGDGSAFTLVTGGGTAPQDLVVNPDTSLDDMGYSSVDSSSRRRFTVYSGVGGASYFTDTTATIQNPTDIICTGDYYFYNATYGGSAYYIKDFDGGTQPDFITDSSNYYLQNVREACFVHGSSEDGELYFVADELGGTADQLFKIDPNDSTTVAHLVTTKQGNPVVGAHNLCSICNDDMFRLYFCAPINLTQNAEYLPTVTKGPAITDDGTKPFVTNEQ